MMSQSKIEYFVFIVTVLGHAPQGFIACIYTHAIRPLHAGAPCYNESVVLDADLEQGTPVQDAETLREVGKTWRIARVQVHDVPQSTMGYGEGGQRPFHQVRAW